MAVTRLAAFAVILALAGVATAHKEYRVGIEVNLKDDNLNKNNVKLTLAGGSLAGSSGQAPTDAPHSGSHEETTTTTTADTPTVANAKAVLFNTGQLFKAPLVPSSQSQAIKKAALDAPAPPPQIKKDPKVQTGPQPPQPQTPQKNLPRPPKKTPAVAPQAASPVQPAVPAVPAVPADPQKDKKSADPATPAVKALVPPKPKFIKNPSPAPTGQRLRMANTERGTKRVKKLRRDQDPAYAGPVDPSNRDENAHNLRDPKSSRGGQLLNQLLSKPQRTSNRHEDEATDRKHHRSSRRRDEDADDDESRRRQSSRKHRDEEDRDGTKLVPEDRDNQARRSHRSDRDEPSRKRDENNREQDEAGTKLEPEDADRQSRKSSRRSDRDEPTRKRDEEQGRVDAKLEPEDRDRQSRRSHHRSDRKRDEADRQRDDDKKSRRDDEWDDRSKAERLEKMEVIHSLSASEPEKLGKMELPDDEEVERKSRKSLKLDPVVGDDEKEDHRAHSDEDNEKDAKPYLAEELRRGKNGYRRPAEDSMEKKMNEMSELRRQLERKQRQGEQAMAAADKDGRVTKLESERQQQQPRKSDKQQQQPAGDNFRVPALDAVRSGEKRDETRRRSNRPDHHDRQSKRLRHHKRHHRRH